MKEMYKKVKTFVGLTLSVIELIDKMADNELYNKEGECVYVDSSSKITVKVKGKVVDIADVTISIEAV